MSISHVLIGLNVIYGQQLFIQFTIAKLKTEIRI